MTSATDELRRLLDECGVEYETDDTQVSDTEWYYVTKLRDGCNDRWIYEEPPDCDLLVSYQYDLDAEDAIAATLGSEDTRAENAKLRELVRTFYHCTTSGECDECPINDGGPVHLMPDTICDTIHDRMRELGVEVDG